MVAFVLFYHHGVIKPSNVVLHIAQMRPFLKRLFVNIRDRQTDRQTQTHTVISVKLPNSTSIFTGFENHLSHGVNYKYIVFTHSLHRLPAVHCEAGTSLNWTGYTNVCGPIELFLVPASAPRLV